MNTQLKVATVVNMDALNVLASEFKDQFDISAEVIHDRLIGRRFMFNRDGKDSYPFDEWEGGSEGEAVPILPSIETVTIASTDSSCILLGETSDGAFYAARAAHEAGGVRAARRALGPPDRREDHQEHDREEDPGVAALVPCPDARDGGRLAEAPPRLLSGLALQGRRLGLVSDRLFKVERHHIVQQPVGAGLEGEGTRVLYGRGRPHPN